MLGAGGEEMKPNLSVIRSRIITMHEKGELSVVIARQLGITTAEVNGIVATIPKPKPRVEHGFSKLQELAREAGVLK